ncbi:MAG: carboxynorspermidine decarboxylase [Leptospiraceae bacterium]|nr:carboxynorspermidine decarboxylase [Leptospiraceae bacterium]
MNWSDFRALDYSGIPSPVHVIDEVQLRHNLSIIKELQDQTGVHILIALKAFAQYSVFSQIRPYVLGATASSLNEAKLAHEYMGGELHLCAPAWPPEDFSELLEIADHIVFNSVRQLRQFEGQVRQSGRHVSMGLRINPEHSEGATAIYDPCAPNSRLGVRMVDLEQAEKEGWLPSIDGLHFHTLCEQMCPPLERTLETVEHNFMNWLERVQWINFGGGHLLTAPAYERQKLIDLLLDFRERHPHLKVYMEPGEAFVIQTGVLKARVLDIVSADTPVAVLDVSAAAHMPDVLEMPYRPAVLDAADPGEKPHTYRLAGLTCLAGDVIGDYSFDRELEINESIFLLDMSHYTMVKNTNFNGVRTPAIAVANLERKSIQLIKSFNYADYKSRLS